LRRSSRAGQRAVQPSPLRTAPFKRASRPIMGVILRDHPASRARRSLPPNRRSPYVRQACWRCFRVSHAIDLPRAGPNGADRIRVKIGCLERLDVLPSVDHPSADFQISRSPTLLAPLFECARRYQPAVGQGFLVQGLHRRSPSCVSRRGALRHMMSCVRTWPFWPPKSVDGLKERCDVFSYLKR
jgi:hypothetical protein